MFDNILVSKSATERLDQSTFQKNATPSQFSDV